MEKGAVLQRLGPFLSRMMKDPLPGNVKAIAEILPQVSPNGLQALQKGIVGSLVDPLLNARVQLETKRHILECITQLVTHTQVSDAGLLWTIYMTTLCLVYDDAKSRTIEGNEELKLAAVKCITATVKQATDGLVSRLYAKSNVPRLSKGVYICKLLVESERLTVLRVAAINCMMTVAHVHDEADESDIVLRHQVGDVVMFFLPGMLSLLRDVILEGDTTPHKVKVIALRAWSRITALVMEDSHATDVDMPSTQPIQDPMKMLQIDWDVRNKQQLVERLNASTRTTSWYQTAAEMITKSLKSIIIAQVHPHWNVRKELALGCNVLVSKCSRNMEPAAGFILDILIVLANDPVEAVSTVSQEGLAVFSEKLRLRSGRNLLTVVEENFYNVITSLPRVLKGLDDAKQLATLNLLIGYIKLLGKEKLSEVFLSAAHLERFVSMLIQAFELDNVAVQLLDDCSIKEVDSVSRINISISWKLFKICTYPEQLTKLMDICKLLGDYADLNMLGHYLLDVFANSVSDRKEVTVILNEVLGTEFAALHVVENILDAYLEPCMWHAPLKAEGCTTVTQARSNVIQACLLLEGIGKMIKNLGTNSEPLLKDVLFPVLARAGSSHELVALFGLEALCCIASAYGHPRDAAHAINDNIDYLCNTVVIKLRRNDGDISALNVLRVMTKHCAAENLPRLKGVLEKAIKQSYGSYQTTDAVLFLEVLQPLMVSLRHLKEQLKPQEVSTNLAIGEIKQVSDEVVEELLSYHRAHTFRDDREAMDRDQLPLKQQNEEEKPKVMSPLTELTVSVMQRCVHLISTTNRQVTLHVLSILQEGLVVLKDQEDDLLPLAHQIWTPLLTRLCHLSDHMVGRYSLQLLFVLAETTRSFVRNRTLQKALPYFCQFLSSNVDSSRKKDVGHAYRFTQLYKLQLEMLQGLGSLAVNIGLQERELYQILTASSAYLSIWQPLPFQRACVQLYTKLAALNKEIVWLKLTELWFESQGLVAPCPGLPTVHLASDGNPEYERNVKDIRAVLANSESYVQS